MDSARKGKGGDGLADESGHPMWRAHAAFPRAGRTRFGREKKSMKRTKIDTGVDLRFVCIDCSGVAVKTAHVMEKKQEVFFSIRRLLLSPRARVVEGKGKGELNGIN